MYGGARTRKGRDREVPHLTGTQDKHIQEGAKKVDRRDVAEVKCTVPRKGQLIAQTKVVDTYPSNLQ